MSSDAPLETDDFAAAIDSMDTAPASSAPVNETAAQAAAAVKEYPPFHPDEWRNDAVAEFVNTAADALAKVRPGTASGDNLGESVAFAFHAYTGKTTKNLPPYAHVLISSGKFTFHVVMQKKDGATDDAPGASDEAARELEARLSGKRGHTTEG